MRGGLLQQKDLLWEDLQHRSNRGWQEIPEESSSSARERPGLDRVPQSSYREKEDRNFVTALMDEKFDSPERARQYLPPKLEDGIVQTSLMVGDTNANNAAAHTGDTEVATEDTESGEIECPEVTMVESVPDIVVVKDEEDREEVVENELGIELDASQKVEADDVSSDGSADREGQQENLIVEGIHELGAEPLLARETSTDPTLAHIRSLAKLEKEGYHARKEVIYRTRLSRQGDPIEQICVPSTFRGKCLDMAHGRFGHQGRNKMVELLRPHFYWPSMSKDCMLHIKQCEMCQKQDKAAVKPSPMQIRESSSVHFENISIDLVGPFPTAVGEFKYLLTAIDLATRWPEAIPLRTTTAKVITKTLMSIFARCGFPARITSDNGPQFKGKFFKKWVRHQGIQHVFSSPYHHQGNGVVEKLHRTLNAMISKLTETRGNWASTIPMALYFLRSTPCSATGMSLFLARQG